MVLLSEVWEPSNKIIPPPPSPDVKCHVLQDSAIRFLYYFTFRLALILIHSEVGNRKSTETSGNPRFSMYANPKPLKRIVDIYFNKWSTSDNYLFYLPCSSYVASDIFQFKKASFKKLLWCVV